MFTLYSINVGGLRGKKRCNTILTHLQSIKVDFLLLQETHLDEKETIQKYFPNSHVYLSPGSTQSGGTCIVVNIELIPTFVYEEDHGRIVILRFFQGVRKLMLLNV